MIRKLDKFLLKICTKFSHWFQRLTGRTCYFIAKIGATLVVASLTVSVLSYVVPILPSKPPPLMLFIYVILIIDLISKMNKLDSAEKNAAESAEQSKVYFIWDGLFSRMLWLTFSVMDTLCIPLVTPRMTGFEIIAYTFFSYGLLVFHYFIAVDPLPPCKSKIKQMLESISAFLAPAKPAEFRAP